MSSSSSVSDSPSGDSNGDRPTLCCYRPQDFEVTILRYCQYKPKVHSRPCALCKRRALGHVHGNDGGNEIKKTRHGSHSKGGHHGSPGRNSYAGAPRHGGRASAHHSNTALEGCLPVWVAYAPMKFEKGRFRPLE